MYIFIINNKIFIYIYCCYFPIFLYSGGYVHRGLSPRGFCPQGVLFRGLCPQGVLFCPQGGGGVVLDSKHL